LVAYEQGRKLKLDEAIAFGLTFDTPKSLQNAISAGS
jgi:hypothetical protein